MVLHLGPAGETTGIGKRNDLAVGGVLPGGEPGNGIHGVAGGREAGPSSRGWAEPAAPGLRGGGEGGLTGTGVPLGPGATPIARSVELAVAALRENHAAGPGVVPHAGGEWRRVYPRRRAATGDTGGGRGMLRVVGGCFTGHPSRGVRCTKGDP